MTERLTCIGCPMGCELCVEVENGMAVSVSGNTCGIGKRYAETEISAPVRLVTSTARAKNGKPVPVKTKGMVPKGKIFDVVRAIKSASVPLPASIGDVILENAAGTGVSVIVTKDVSE